MFPIVFIIVSVGMGDPEVAGDLFSLSIYIYTIFTIYLLIFGSLVPKETLSCTFVFFLIPKKNTIFGSGHPRMGARVWVECPLNTGFSRILSCSLVTSTSKGRAKRAVDKRTPR